MRAIELAVSLHLFTSFNLLKILIFNINHKERFTIIIIIIKSNDILTPATTTIIITLIIKRIIIKIYSAH